MTYVQEPPFCLQIELVEGCNLRCPFCGLNGIRGKQNSFKFMSFELAIRITDLLKKDNWRPRIEFAMHGEPSLYPHLPSMLEIFRRRLPRSIHLMMTSNGAGFLKDPTTSIDKALQYLNVLALDSYEYVNIVPKILERYKGRHSPIFYPKDLDGNPHRRRKQKEHDLVIVQDIKTAVKGTHASLNNHAGCGSPLNNSAQGKRCAKPFREMSIRWDGNVAICCNDWRGVYQCGSVRHLTLEEIWQSTEFQAARKFLYHGQRVFQPCKGCDALSYRPGLLPDKMGKKSLPQPTSKDLDIVTEAVEHEPYTLPVLRSWET